MDQIQTENEPQQMDSDELKKWLLEQRDLEASLVKLLYVSHFTLMSAAKKYGGENYLMAAWSLEVLQSLIVGDIKRAELSFKSLAKQFIAYQNKQGKGR